MSEPPPHKGGNFPFWSRGDWWQQQPDGSFLRWSAFNDEWLEPVDGGRPDSPEEVAARKNRARRQFLMVRLPVIIVVLAAALLNLGLVGAAAQARGGFGRGLLLILLFELFLLGLIVNWLVKKP